MRLKMRTMLKYLGGAAAAAIVASGAMASVVYNFGRNIENNTSYSGADFNLVVKDAGPNKVTFRFENNAGFQSAITPIYFYHESGFLTGGHISDKSSGVNFVAGGAPPNLPGGDAYDLSSAARFSASPPPPHNGLNPGEWLEITFDIDGTYDDVIARIEAGRGINTTDNKYNDSMLVIGIHVIHFPGGGSDSYLLDLPHFQTIIPLPPAAWIGLAGLAGVAVLRRRRPV